MKMGILVYASLALVLAGAVLSLRQCDLIPMPHVDCANEESCASIWAAAMRPYTDCRNKALFFASLALVGLTVKGVIDFKNRGTA